MARDESEFGRSGAYAVILDRGGRVLLVETNGGRLYLPGGRLEPSETPEQALLRELVEECGCTGELIAAIGEVEQPIHGGRQMIRAHFYHARLVERVGPGEHKSFWLDPGAAADSVHRAGDAWAISRLLGLRDASAAAPAAADA